MALKVALQIWGPTFYNNTKKESSLYSHSLLIFIHKTPLFENRPTTREIRELLRPSTRQQILDSSKLKEFADDNFKLDENGRKLSKRVENTVGKGEIARNEQFLLFPQCFRKA